MLPRSILVVVVFSVLVAALSIRCGKPEGGKSTAVTQHTRNPGEDFKATMDAHNKARDDETKTRLWLDFLKRNPNNNYTVGTIGYVINTYYLEQKKDPDGAVRFALEHMSKIQDEKFRKRADSQLMQLYGKVGRKAELRELVAKIDAQRGLGLDGHLAAANAAAEAKDWDLARTQCQELLKQNTAEKLRSDPQFEKSSAEDIRKALERNRGQAVLILGRAALDSGETNAALAHFAEAGKLARYDFTGLPAWPLEDLNLHWARALLKSGDAKAALQKVSVDAMIQEKEEALSILADAHRAAGVKGDLRQYIQRVEPTIAKGMPAFSVYDYRKNRFSWDDLKGSVTLLAFWFPT